MKVNQIPLRKKIALDLYTRYRQNESRLHKLNYIFWECTLRCNLNCLHCGSDCSKNVSAADMPAEDFFRALDQLAHVVDPNHTTIVLTGGEALLRNDLEEIGEGLYRRGFPWGVVTNGMLLSRQKLASLLKCGLRAVTISLDGLEQSHNWLRNNKNSFRNAMQAIGYLSAADELVYDVVTCASQRNLQELPEVKELLIQHGVCEWRIFTVFPVGRARLNSELQLEPESFKALFDYIKETRKDKRIRVSYGCEGFLGNFEAEVRDNFFFCRAGINIASVLVDGSISACPNLRGNFIQGSIYKDDISSVWENQFKVFRDRSWTRTGICAACRHYKYCEGNGMHLRNEHDGELLFCHLQRLKEGE